MGRIVFASPGPDRFHLLDRLRGELAQRGHHVDVLLVDRSAHTFWQAQGTRCTLLREEREESAGALQAPLDEFAAAECTRLVVPTTGHGRRRAHRAIAKGLCRQLPAALHWLAEAKPDLILLCGARTASRRLLHFVGRELGIGLLWIGDGLLPHTMQIDGRSIDGDASSCKNDTFDYRSARNEPALLDACLCNLLANTTPFALARREVVVPPRRQRWQNALSALWRGSWREFAAALHDWRRALATPERAPATYRLPTTPFVTVLLQHDADERVRLDSAAPPSAFELVAATALAAHDLDPTLRTVAVLPGHGLPARTVRAIRHLPQVHVVPAAAAAEAAATAVAVTTINHPLAISALLAGTPVLHCGRALYGLPTVTWHRPLGEFRTALREAVREDESATLRQRFLSTLLSRGHLWCSPTHPDHNGLIGLVQAIERRLCERRLPSPGSRYRTGPAWPLSASRRDGAVP